MRTFFFKKMMFFVLLLKTVFVLISVAYYTASERKIMASIQRRKGPNIVGPLGLFQPLADGLKLLIKETVVPQRSNQKIFFVAPLTIFILSMVIWILIPGNQMFEDNLKISEKRKFFFFKNFLEKENENFFFEKNLDFFSFNEFTILLVLAISSINVYGVVAAGWASYSKYAFLGALRSSAQMISYEVSISLIILPIIILNGTFGFSEIVNKQLIFGWNCLFLMPSSVFFFISMLAETNRTPFDLPEAEAELVAGYNVEYSSMIFAMFFLGEYNNMISMSIIISLLFFGGWLFPFFPGSISLSMKTMFFCYVFVLTRALLPRYKYNQLMNLGWKFFLPSSISLFLITSVLFY